MRALLMKDFFTVMKQMKIYVALIVLFAVLPDVNLSAFAGCYAAMLTFSALAYDEQSKWDQLAITMPFSARELVLSKYAMGYLVCGAVAVLSLAMNAVFAAFHIVPIAPVSDFLSTIPCGPLVMALTLPMMYRMGAEKGRMVMLVVLAMFIGVTVFLSNVMPVGGGTSADGREMMGVCIIWLITIALNALSIFLSTRWYGYTTR